MRDLGGLRTRGGAHTLGGSLVRGDDPSYLREQGWELLRSYGVRTIVDLRYGGETHAYRVPPAAAETAARAGVEVVRAPLLAPPGHPSSRGIYDSGDPAASYRLMVDRRAPQIARALGALARAQRGGVLVHCTAGRDRTGVVVALALWLCDVEPRAIAEDYAHSRARIERAIASLEQTPATRDAARRNALTAAATMHALLAHIDERHGGVHAYVAAAGLGSEDVRAIRRRVLGEGS